MRKIICVSILVFLLCTSIGLAESKFEIGMFSGSYQIFTRHNPPELLTVKGDYIYGYEASYRLSPRFRIQVQLDSFDAVGSSPGYPVWYKIETKGISILAVFDLFHYGSQTIYGGIGVTSQEIKIWKCNAYGSIPYYVHNFDFPLGMVYVVGSAISYHFLQLKGEIHIMGSAGGKLDWNGYKFLIGVGVKF
jgi:hypothetical protein